MPVMPKRTKYRKMQKGRNRGNLVVSEIYANQGPTMKRIRPAAKGSASRIRKRTSHITIKLREV